MNEERAALHKSARDFMDRWSPPETVRTRSDTAAGFDAAVWQRMASLGWPALLVPEVLGGMGASLADAAVVARELGAHAALTPFLSTAVLAATALTAGGAAPFTDLLGSLADGTAYATAAITGPSGGPGVSSLGVSGRPENGGWLLSGEAYFVPDLVSADYLVVAAVTPLGEPLLVLTPSVVSGVMRTAVELIDRTRRAGTLYLNDVHVGREAVIAHGEAAARLLDTMFVQANVILAADAVGAAARALDLALAYARQRVQFGRPIGSFQAIKHKLADMFLLVESATTAIDQAAEHADRDLSARRVASAVSYAQEAAVRVAGDAIQVHGGIGFTWEHDCHILLKRALLDEAMLGGPAYFRGRIVSALLERAD